MKCLDCTGCLACFDHKGIDWDELDRQWEHDADDIEEMEIERYEER